MVKNCDFGSNYWGDGGQILGGCIPPSPGICSPDNMRSYNDVVKSRVVMMY